MVKASIGARMVENEARQGYREVSRKAGAQLPGYVTLKRILIG